jgi:hypothetical protein
MNRLTVKEISKPELWLRRYFDPVDMRFQTPEQEPMNSDVLIQWRRMVATVMWVSFTGRPAGTFFNFLL